MRHPSRHLISSLSFVIFVILIPVWFGLFWIEHQRTDDLSTLIEERREMLVESCERGNVVRREFRELVQADKEQARLLIDYMNMDLGSALPNAAERQALKRLTELYERANAVTVMPIVDCEAVIT